MAEQKLTIEIPDGDDVEVVLEEVAAWLRRGMTSGFYPNWTLEDVTEPATPETAEQITQRVLELESLGTWEERLKAAVYLARDEKFRVTECGHNDQGLTPDRLVICHECGTVFPPAPESPEQIAERVLDNHRIRPDWRRTGEQIIPLLAEAVRIARGEQS